MRAPRDLRSRGVLLFARLAPLGVVQAAGVVAAFTDYAFAVRVLLVVLAGNDCKFAAAVVTEV